MRIPVRLGLTSVTSPMEVGANEAADLLLQLRAGFARVGNSGVEIVTSGGPVSGPQSAVSAGRRFYDERVDAICVIAATWFEDYLLLDMLEECNVPIIAWSRPGMETGSLCGMHQLAYMLRQLGKPYLVIYDPPDVLRSARRAVSFARSAALFRRLRSARIGYIGHRVEGMTETTGHELALKRVFGPRVVGIDTRTFMESAGRVAPILVESHWQDLVAQVGRVSATEEAGLESLQVYTALKRRIDADGLSAVAVGCYPHLMGKVCMAASLLAEGGVPVACEGDVNGALGMLILTWLTGAPVHNTDILDPLAKDDAIVFSHCGSGGFSLAPSLKEIELAPVRLQHRGLCCLFPARPGPITLLNTTPTLGGYRMATMFGDALDTDMVFPGNPLKVRFPVDYRQALEWITDQGLGHHWMAAYGDHRQALKDLAQFVECEYTVLE